VAVAELMRVLVDEHGLGWDEAWDITVRTFAYTNHTLLAEALERWPVALFERLLPRHLQIIYEINARFLRAVLNRWPNDDPSARAHVASSRRAAERRCAWPPRHRRRAQGQRRAELHTDLLKRDVLHDFAELWPERFNNKTNGVTPRRWLLSCNPRSRELITETIGPGWPTNLDRSRAQRPSPTTPAVQRAASRAIKRENKVRLAELGWRHLRVARPRRALRRADQAHP
jgi:starch phosphorylase